MTTNLSMALWYERRERTRSQPRRVAAEVHFNLWRHIGETLGAGETNFLEIGVLFRDAYEMARAFLFIPASLSEAEVEDLSPKLENETTLSAVFNDVVTLSAYESNSWFNVQRQGSHYLTVHRFGAGDYSVEPIGGPDLSEQGTLLRFSEGFCSRLRSAGPHYVRIRVHLSAAAATRFSYLTESGDILTSSVQTAEITEIRFNEMRNLPREVSRMLDAELASVFAIYAAHCFFMRDMRFELAAAHASFHKMRRLEAVLWKGYLEPKVPAGATETMLVYHWRALAKPGDDIGSFIALAKFRATKLKLGLFISIGLTLGALGSAIEGWLSTLVGSADAANHERAMYLLGCALLVLMGLALGRTAWRKILAHLGKRR